MLKDQRDLLLEFNARNVIDPALKYYDAA